MKSWSTLLGLGTSALFFPRVLPWAEIGERLRRKARKAISFESHSRVSTQSWGVNERQQGRSPISKNEDLRLAGVWNNDDVRESKDSSKLPRPAWQQRRQHMFSNLIESSSHAREFKRRGSFLLYTIAAYSLLFVGGG